jgi:hypothetical protein
MGLTIPRPQESRRLRLVPGGTPADDVTYLAWRDELLGRHAERLVARFWHTRDLVDLLPGWAFDDALVDRLTAGLPLERDIITGRPTWNYAHRLRFLAVRLREAPETLRTLAEAILAETAP